MKRTVAGAALLACAAAAGWLASARGRALAPEQLVPGQRLRAELSSRDDWSRRFELAVPTDAIALRIELTSAQSELCLHADWGSLPEAHGDAAYRGDTDGGLGRILIDRFSEPPLASGRLEIEVAWNGRGAPRTSEAELRTIGFTLLATSFAGAVDGVLAPGANLAGSIPPRGPGVRSYRIDVPPAATRLRVDLSDALGDLDLYARPGKPVGRLDEGLRFARHLWGRESLVLGDDEPLGQGPWFVDVVDTHDEERDVGFRLWCRLGPEPPPELLALPVLPDAHPGPLGHALACVVELFGDESAGSGTLISPAGWILTNAHVVTSLGGGREQEVVVACTLDPHAAPVELFRAELVEFDAARDLALLRVVRGFLGQELPPDYRFPAVELGSPDELPIGSPLWLIGYPSTGGLGSLVTLHCTRGIVSGFDTSAFGTVLKTDAEITGGNSGGAAVDEHGHLVGLPTSLVEQDSGQAGFVHPWNWMPESWRARMRPAGAPSGR